MGNGQKIRFVFGVLIFLSVLFIASFGLAAAPASTPSGLDKAFEVKGNNMPLKNATDAAGYNISTTYKTLTGAIITAVLSLMGVIFLILAIYAGYNWMTARGDEEKVTKAKDTLTNAVIGLIVVLAAYAISYFIISRVSAPALKSTTNYSELE